MKKLLIFIFLYFISFAALSQSYHYIIQKSQFSPEIPIVLHLNDGRNINGTGVINNYMKYIKFIDENNVVNVYHFSKIKYYCVLDTEEFINNCYIMLDIHPAKNVTDMRMLKILTYGEINLLSLNEYVSDFDHMGIKYLRFKDTLYYNIHGETHQLKNIKRQLLPVMLKTRPDQITDFIKTNYKRGKINKYSLLDIEQLIEYYNLILLF